MPCSKLIFPFPRIQQPFLSTIHFHSANFSISTKGKSYLFTLFLHFFQTDPLQAKESEVLAGSEEVFVSNLQDSLWECAHKNLWPKASEGVQGKVWHCLLLWQLSKCSWTTESPTCRHLYCGTPCPSLVKSAKENLQGCQTASDPKGSHWHSDTLKKTWRNQNDQIKVNIATGEASQAITPFLLFFLLV